MSRALQGIFKRLPAETQDVVLSTLNSHASYLNHLESVSRTRMQRIIDNMAANSEPIANKPGNTTPRRFFGSSNAGTGINTPASSSGANSPKQTESMNGPGIFLCRWQELLDRTIVTPAMPKGPLRTGKDVKTITAVGKAGSGGAKDIIVPGLLTLDGEDGIPDPPNVDAVRLACGPLFRDLTVEMHRDFAYRKSI